MVEHGRFWLILVGSVYGRFLVGSWSVLGRFLSFFVGFGRFWSVLFSFWSVLSAWSVPAGILSRFGRVMVGSVILVGSDLCVLSSFTV